MKVTVNSEVVDMQDTAENIPVRYEQEVAALIRTRYSVDDELAILRQRDTKPDEFAEYNGFCEYCKAQARAKTGASNG